MSHNINTPYRVGIVGFGNLGKGVVKALSQNPDLELIAIFSRRAPETLDTSVPAYPFEAMEQFKDRIDVMLMCGGSATDLPEQVLQVSKLFNTVDSFDTHARIPEYFATVDAHSRQHGTLSLISTGWDPGLFSLNRLLGECILPIGATYTFWGKGLSQGHSDALRKLAGVKNAVQYTIPLEEAKAAVRSGLNPQLSTADKHQRVCYVVAEEGVDQIQLKHTIQTMPHYFADYQTEVHFITETELLQNHSKMPHGGTVFRSGSTASGHIQRLEFSLELESNPEFTSSVLVAYARAVCKMAQKGQTGALTVFDIPFGALSPKSPEELRASLL